MLIFFILTANAVSIYWFTLLIITSSFQHVRERQGDCDAIWLEYDFSVTKYLYQLFIQKQTYSKSQSVKGAKYWLY